MKSHVRMCIHMFIYILMCVYVYMSVCVCAVTHPPTHLRGLLSASVHRLVGTECIERRFLMCHLLCCPMKMGMG